MKNSNKKILITLLTLALVGMVIFYYGKQYIPKYHWDENYINTNDQPYGLKFLFDLFSKSRPKSNFIVINKELKYVDFSDTSSLYVFIGGKYYIDETSSYLLINFVKRGNNVFISSKESTHNIFSILTQGKKPIIYCKYYNDSLVHINLNNGPDTGTFQFDYKLLKKRAINSWYCFDSLYFADTLSFLGFEKISSIRNCYVDCFRIKCGKGWFIFHFNPVLLSNYVLTGKDGYRYINSLFSQYNKKTIIWDEYSKLSLYNRGYGNSHETPLRFILSERSLKWAWYLICIFVLIFIVVNAKRKQAFIPVMQINRNTTIEYLNSISVLYYQNNSLEFLADQIFKQLSIFLKHKYDISVDVKKQETVKLLALKSSVSEEKINELFTYYSYVKYSFDREKKELIKFYQLTEYFYKNCK